MINSNVVFTFLFGGKRGWIMIFVSWKNSKTYQVSSWIIDEWIYGKGQPPFFINLMQLLWGAQDEGDVNRTSVQTLIGCDCGVRTLLAVGKVRFLQTLCNLPLSLYVWQNCNENEQLSKTSLVILIDFLSENRLKLKKVRIYKAVRWNLNKLETPGCVSDSEMYHRQHYPGIQGRGGGRGPLFDQHNSCLCKLNICSKNNLCEARLGLRQAEEKHRPGQHSISISSQCLEFYKLHTYFW